MMDETNAPEGTDAPADAGADMSGDAAPADDAVDMGGDAAPADDAAAPTAE